MKRNIGRFVVWLILAMISIFPKPIFALQHFNRRMRRFLKGIHQAYWLVRLRLHGAYPIAGGVDTARQRQKFTEIGGLGFRVDRATGVLAQTADLSIFTIAGGRVLVTLILGEVTTVIETQANATLLKLNPTATGADQDLCASLDIDSDAVGAIYTLSGTVGDAMRDDLLIGAGMTQPLILSEGIIELECAASNTGAVQWTIFYLPIDDGAYIEAA